MGDPMGIGPEVVVKAVFAAAREGRARFVIYGTEAALNSAATSAGLPRFWHHPPKDAPSHGARAIPVHLQDYTPAQHRADPAWLSAGARNPAGATREGGDLSFRFVRDAVTAALAPTGSPSRPDAVVTAPISKSAWHLAGHTAYAGHTELLADLCGQHAGGQARDSTRMMFVAPGLSVVLATTHIALRDVPGALSVRRVLATITLGAAACRRLGVRAPRVAVCGLNPHASEGGLFGDEEQRIISPAIEQAVRAGIDASGPFPGDTIFNAALKGRFDLVVAMYHDQGLIPVKLLSFDKAVNATIGLPIVRTSPDHGTAFDIAGRNLADEGSMKAAIDLAIRLCAAPASQPV